jgi:hypothetical protein
MRDIFRNSYEFWRKHFFALCFLGLGYQIPRLIIASRDIGPLKENPGLFFGLFILSVIFLAFSHTTILIYTGRNLEDHETTVWEAFVSSIGRVVPMLVCQFAILIASAVGGILLIVPGIYIYLTTLHARYFIVVRGLPFVDSVKASHLLMKGQHFFALKLFIAMVAFCLPIYVVIYMGLDAFFAGSENFIEPIIFMPFYAFFEVVSVVFYFYCQKEKQQAGATIVPLETF